MHELIAFLLGCCICCGAFYIWWTRRRFKALKASFVAVLGRAESLDNRYDRLDHRLDRFATIIERHQREVSFLLADREVPPPDGIADEMGQEKAELQPTVWERLRANVEDL